MRHNRFVWIGAMLGALLIQPAMSRAAQPPDPVVDPLDERVSRFFEMVSQKRIKTAYEDLLGAKQLGSQEDRKLLEDQTGEIEKTYGAYRGFERVYKKQVGSDLVFVKYLYKCNRFPVLWHVTFYRSAASGELAPESRTWQVVSIRFDTDLDLLALLLREN